MFIAKYQGYFATFTNQLFEIFIWTKLNRNVTALRCTMIRVTERTVKLSFVDNFFIFTLDHLLFNAIAASSFSAAIQYDWFPVFKIVRQLAQLAH